MIRKNFLFLIASLLAAGVVIYFLYPGIRSTDGKCKLCGEAIHEGMRYTVLLSDGGKIKTCCPTCGLHLQVHDPGNVTSASATSYTTSEPIDAIEAFYVEGSDVHHCDPERMMRNEMGGVSMMDWHRCDPSLVAFGSRQTAAVFQTQYGGRILSFGEAKEAVKSH